MPQIVETIECSKGIKAMVVLGVIVLLFTIYINAKDRFLPVTSMKWTTPQAKEFVNKIPNFDLNADVMHDLNVFIPIKRYKPIDVVPKYLKQGF